MSASPISSPAAISPGEAARRVWDWGRREPLAALLLAGCVATLVYFFGFFKVFSNGQLTTARWAFEAWNEGNDLEHGPLILPGALVVVWMHREALRRAVKGGSWLGLPVILAGVLAFLAAAWTSQARVAMVALPILLLGSVWFACGRAVARQVLFPCALLLFMVPVGFLLGHTEPLQRLVASTVHGICAALGLGIDRVGVKLLAMDGSFQCEVAGGCSGIRSLMAMALLGACYAHFTQDRFWKKVLLFSFALPSAVVGNIVRVFTIILVSKFVNPTVGTGAWHDISGFVITIPIAMFLMVRFGDLLSRDWGAVTARAGSPTPLPAKVSAAKGAPASPSAGPISYDY